MLGLFASWCKADRGQGNHGCMQPICIEMGKRGAQLIEFNKTEPSRHGLMELGPFSICLAVKDLQASKSFYEKLGFTALSRDSSNDNWLVMKNGETEIGIFQGIFDKNTLCFNPGGKFGKPLPDFTDIREIYRALKAKGVETMDEAGLTSRSGPAGFFVMDPDGNPILFDQHV